MKNKIRYIDDALDLTLQDRRRFATDIHVGTQDFGSVSFYYTFAEELVLDSVSTDFVIGKNVITGIAATKVTKGKVYWETAFDSTWIAEDVEAVAYVYASVGDRRYDVAEIHFKAFVSKRDELIEQIEIVYNKQIEDLIEEFREKFESVPIPQDGKSAYEIWLDEGNAGSVSDFLASLKGQDGDSAYQVWLNAGNIGTVADFLASLQATVDAESLEPWVTITDTSTKNKILQMAE